MLELSAETPLTWTKKKKFFLDQIKVEIQSSAYFYSHDSNWNAKVILAGRC